MSDTALPVAAGRDLDVQIAEKVMGWRWATFVRIAVLMRPDRYEAEVVGRPWLGWTAGIADAADERDIDGRYFPYPSGTRPQFPPVPRFSTDIAAAWEVKEWVRELMGVNAPLWDARIAPVAAMPAADAAEFICREALATVEASHV